MDIADLRKETAAERVARHRARAEAAMALLELSDLGAISMSHDQRQLTADYARMQESQAVLAAVQISPIFPDQAGATAHG
jgi:hypothetical protein